MKITALAAVSLAATVAVAAPVAEKRQGCTYGFVFARGSTEPSPLVSLVLLIHFLRRCEVMLTDSIRVYLLDQVCRAH
jgi:hypothetical protein